MTAPIEVPITDPNPIWVNLMHESLQDVFSLMLRMDVTPCDDLRLVPELTAIVGLAGSIRGLFAIRCSRLTGAELASTMVGSDVAGHEAQIFDALGEICNMVAGNFKAKLRGLGDSCLLAIPTTVAGEDYDIYPPEGGKTLEVFVQCANLPIQAILHVTN